MPPTTRLADPPREIPPGLKLRLLAHPDVAGSLLFWVPAVVAVAFSFAAPTKPRLVILAFVAIMLVLGLRFALRGLARGARELDSMRYGFVTAGRMVSCYLAWDRKSKEMPTDDFLGNWVVIVGKSQVSKAFGCFMVFVMLAFAVPFGLAALVFAGTLVLGLLGHVAIDAEASRFLLLWIGVAVLFVAVLPLILRYSRRHTVKEVERYIQWRKLAKPGRDDMYDDDAVALVEAARKSGVDLTPKEPLPQDYSRVELICRVEYSIRGERQMGEGLVRLCDRLDPAGVERLLFHPERPGKVVFMAGLPDEVRIDARGRWEDVPAAPPATALALTGVVAGSALVGFAWQLPWFMSLYR